MAIEQEVMQEPLPAESPDQLTEEEETDLQIVTQIAQNAIDDGGIEVIEKAVEQSSDPGQVIGQFLMQLAVQMEESMPQGMEISKRIFFASGGWVEQMSDFLQEEYGISKEVMDRAEIYIASTAQQMAAQRASPEGAPPAGPEAAPAPAGAPMPAMPQGAV